MPHLTRAALRAGAQPAHNQPTRSSPRQARHRARDSVRHALTNPAFPPGPYRFINREYFIIQYRTDPEALRRLVPEPLELAEPVVNYEFIRMPDSIGFGDDTESGQVIPMSYQGQAGGFIHQMFLNDHPPIAGGRELWGFPKKLAQPTLAVETDTLVGTLNYGSVRIATGTMGYKHRTLDAVARRQRYRRHSCGPRAAGDNDRHADCKRNGRRGRRPGRHEPAG
jgi:acetoacetate decarboxylase